MVYNITGFKFGSFTDDKGKRVDYSNVFVSIPIAPEKGENGTFSGGYYTQKISIGRVITDDTARKIINGAKHIDLNFDMFGKVVSCIVVNPK